VAMVVCFFWRGRSGGDMHYGDRSGGVRVRAGQVSGLLVGPKEWAE
jgi:hypothetical protein